MHREREREENLLRASNTLFVQVAAATLGSLTIVCLGKTVNCFHIVANVRCQPLHVICLRLQPDLLSLRGAQALLEERSHCRKHCEMLAVGREREKVRHLRMPSDLFKANNFKPVLSLDSVAVL